MRSVSRWEGRGLGVAWLRGVFVLAAALLVGCEGSKESAAGAGDEDALGSGELRDTPGRLEDAPTWNEEVGPFMARACGACHQPGGSGQFSLLDHPTAAAFAAISVMSVEDRRMPPWPADPECRTFQHQRVVSPEELAMLQAWVAGETPVGQGAPQTFEAPELPTLRADLTASMPEPYTPAATLTDDYRCFVMDLTFDEDTWVVGSQVVPGSAQVHHVLLYALTPAQADAALRAAEAEAGPGYTCFGGPLPGGGVSSPPTQIGAWVPGVMPSMLPPGTAMRIAPGERIVMQVHYNTVAGEPEPDVTVFQLQLLERAPQWLWRTRPIAQRDLLIRAGDRESTHSITITNHQDEPIVIGSVAGHMHNIGASLNVTIGRSDGSEECLLDIPHWSFDWQLFYDLPSGAFASVAPGESIRLTCVYDNSPENQPVIDGQRQEPRDVRWGDGSLDEMCLAYIGVVSPWIPATPSGDRCEAARPCVAACDPLDLACILSCPGLTTECLTCLFQGLIPCASGCAGVFQQARTCLTTCAMSNVSLGSPIAACMRAECGARWDALATCLDPILEEGRCASAFTSCDLLP